MDYPGELPERPMSVQEITAKAEDYEWNPAIKFVFWVGAADTIYREGQNYLREGNFSAAYLFLYRHLNLVLNHLRNHPSAKSPESQAAFKPILDRLPTIFKDLENLKPRISKAHDEWLKIDAAQRNSPKPGKPLSWNPPIQTKVLDASKNQDLAVSMARRDFYRHGVATAANGQRSTPSNEYEDGKYGRWGNAWAFSNYGNDEADSSYSREGSDDESFLDADYAEAYQQQKAYDDQKRRMDLEAAREGDRRAGKNVRFDLSKPARGPSTSYSYPSISKPAPVRWDQEGTREYRREPGASQQPPRPPKIQQQQPSLVRSQPAPPAVPQKTPLEHRNELPPRNRSELPPHVDGQRVKEKIVFHPVATSEDGEPLRPVFIADTLHKTFLNIAADNTRRGLETCGILCGRFSRGALFITYLAIPEQVSTPDTCETINEFPLIQLCSERAVQVMGWIHTHPTQSCFMSSRDLHTHAGYQHMQHESIAIVCAPNSTPSIGIFRLTKPPGLPHVISCTNQDTFHQHSIDDIYTDASAVANPRHGHVFESDKLRSEFKVVDLRPKR